MNKKELIQSASVKCGMLQIETAKALSAIIETISESIAKEESVVLQGFGSFVIRERKARKGVNPVTKKAITIPAAKVVRFKVSKKKIISIGNI